VEDDWDVVEDNGKKDKKRRSEIGNLLKI